MDPSMAAVAEPRTVFGGVLAPATLGESMVRLEGALASTSLAAFRRVLAERCELVQLALPAATDSADGRALHQSVHIQGIVSSVA